MEDFGYSKHDENSSSSSLLKRVFLIGATMFSLACFGYVTVNAYYYVYNDKNNNIETIKAPADPLKIVEVETKSEDELKIDSSIYEDIFGNKKHKEREIKIRENAETALPPKVKDVEEIIKKPVVAQNNSAPNEENSRQKNAAKSNQIIVYSDKKPEVDNKNFLNQKPARVLQNEATQAEQKSSAPAKQEAAAKGKKMVRVQIAALTSKQAADEYWRNLQRKHSGLFSSLKSFVEEVDLGKRGTFYRLQIGNFYDQIRAEEFCNKYIAQTKKNRADCIVIE